MRAMSANCQPFQPRQNKLTEAGWGLLGFAGCGRRWAERLNPQKAVVQIASVSGTRACFRAARDSGMMSTAGGIVAPGKSLYALSQGFTQKRNRTYVRDAAVVLDKTELEVHAVSGRHHNRFGVQVSKPITLQACSLQCCGG